MRDYALLLCVVVAIATAGGWVPPPHPPQIKANDCSGIAAEVFEEFYGVRQPDEAEG